MLTRRSFLARTAALGVGAAAASLPGQAGAQETRSFTFAYDQPKDTAYSFMADTFEKKLGELSGGKFKTGFPNAALGSEPETAQKVRAGDIDFVINATRTPSRCRSPVCLPTSSSGTKPTEKAMNIGINDAFSESPRTCRAPARSDSSRRASGTCIPSSRS